MPANYLPALVYEVGLIQDLDVSHFAAKFTSSEFENPIPALVRA